MAGSVSGNLGGIDGNKPVDLFTVTADGGSLPRTMSDRFSDFINVLDYDPGFNDDDALRIRSAVAAAVAEGKGVILIPPGVYLFKSQTIQPGPFNDQVTPCVLFNGVNNLTVIAHGASFYIDDSITFPNASYSNCGTGHLGFTGNCHNVKWFGGRFYGNTLHAGSAVNCGLWFQNVTGLHIEDTEWLGDYHAGPIFTGVWGFDCTIRNNRSYGSGNGCDFAYMENLTFTGNRMDGGNAGGAVASCGFKLFSDVPTATFNTAGQTLAQVTDTKTGAVRQLRGGVSNNIRIFDNSFSGWITNVFVDGVDGVKIFANTMRDGVFATIPNSAGVAIVTSTQTHTAGFITRNVFIHDNEFVALGGPAVILAPATSGLGAIEVVGNRIYDNNCPAAVYFTSVTALGSIRLERNDFNSRSGGGLQLLPIDPVNLPSVFAAGGTYRENLGATSSLTLAPPVTVTTTPYTVPTTVSTLLLSPAAGQTLALGTATAGRVLFLKLTTAFAVISSSSNVVPQAGGAAGTAILAATAGKWAVLQGDGTSWQILMSN